MTAPPVTHCPAYQLLRYLTVAHVKVYAWFWATLMVVLTAAVVAIDTFATVEFSLWSLIGQSAPKWFLLVIAIAAATGGLPVYVAHGITRRHVAVASGALYLGTAALFGLLTLGGYGLEWVLFRIAGLGDDFTGPYPVPSLEAAAWMVTQATVLAILWTCAGWQIGAGYYRLGAARGTLFIVPASLPAIVGELTINNDEPGSRLAGLASLPTHLAALMVAGAVLVALAGAFLLVRDMPIRRRSA